jgi:transcriptional regulator with XRE-family HTH domain
MDGIRKDPGRAERIDAMRRGIEDALALARLREDAGLTQQDLADALAAAQANVSRIERSGDLYLSTLRRYVEAMGGTLEVAAVFPDGRVPLAVGDGIKPAHD